MSAMTDDLVGLLDEVPSSPRMTGLPAYWPTRRSAKAAGAFAEGRVCRRRKA